MNGAASSVREITEESSSEEATSHEVTFERGAISDEVLSYDVTSD